MYIYFNIKHSFLVDFTEEKDRYLTVAHFFRHFLTAMFHNPPFAKFRRNLLTLNNRISFCFPGRISDVVKTVSYSKASYAASNNLDRLKTKYKI